jgi:hypothetical protein
MPTETTDLTHEILKRIQSDIAGLRQEIRANQQNFVDVARVVQRMDARLSDVKADLETMFKMELIGQLTHFETRFENVLDTRFDAILNRLDQLGAK